MLFDQLVESITGQKFNVRCIRGPYWLPNEDPDADEHFAYECTLNGKKIIIGEEPEDEFRYVYEADKDTYNFYSKYKKEIMPLIRKAIEQHEQKQRVIGHGASEEQADTITKI
jgi:hypothetical protein